MKQATQLAFYGAIAILISRAIYLLNNIFTLIILETVKLLFFKQHNFA